MKLITKNTHILFLFLAAIVFNAHSIIPHDHHQFDSDICTSTRNPFTDNHHPVFPMHCHAFNDMVSEKAVVVDHFQTLSFFDAIPSDVQDISLAEYSEPFNGDPEQPVHSIPSELFSLRAPPSLMLAAGC